MNFEESLESRGRTLIESNDEASPRISAARKIHCRPNAPFEKSLMESSQVNPEAISNFLQVNPRSAGACSDSPTDRSSCMPQEQSPAAVSDEVPGESLDLAAMATGFAAVSPDPLSVWRIQSAATGLSELVLEDWAINSNRTKFAFISFE